MTLPDIIFPAIVVALLVGLLYYCCKIEETESKRLCAGGAFVESVGGCDRYGQCGVKMSNGRTGRLYMPVVGAYCE